MFKVIVFIVFALPLQLFAAEDPDARREAFFHDIYKNFNELPTPEESWQQALQGSNQQIYSIQKGDTLWDISSTFFADPQFWPKIWSLNSSEIFNPHEISPENQVVFVPGSLAEPPRLAVEEKPSETATPEAPAEPTEAAAAADQDKSIDESLKFEIPPPKPTKPVSNLPASFPPWNMTKEKVAKVVFDGVDRSRAVPPANFAIDYYLADVYPTPEGEILETEMGMKTAAEFQYVHVKMNGASAGTAKDFLVVKNSGEIADKFSEKSGTLVEVQGIVQILELINAEENIYRALVKKTIHQIAVGSHLISGELPQAQSGGEGQAVDLPARIIGGQFATDRRMYSRDNLVFLNAGSQQGVSLGQSLSVYKVPQLRNAESRAYSAPLRVGEIKVVKVSENFATAIILNSDDDIRTGDSTSPDIKTTTDN